MHIKHANICVYMQGYPRYPLYLDNYIDKSSIKHILLYRVQGSGLGFYIGFYIRFYLKLLVEVGLKMYL